MMQLITCAFVGFLTGAVVGGFVVLLIVGQFLGWLDSLCSENSNYENLG